MGVAAARAVREAAPHVTVVGDLMLDGWWRGRSDRMCREAPAPVVEIEDRTYSPGGAANTALNLASMGARVSVVGAVGTDEAGRRLRALLVAGGVDVADMVTHPRVRTVTKTRIVGGDQVIARLDDQQHSAFPPECTAHLVYAAGRALRRGDAVVLCDFGSGLLTEDVVAELARRRASGLVVVDAHDAARWAAVRPDLVTPNAHECANLLGLADLGEDRVGSAELHAAELLAATGAAQVVVTLDRDGAVLLDDGGLTHRTWARPTSERQASGAGDTFVAALALGRLVSLSTAAAMDLAQAAADVVVHRLGTSVCTTDDLEAALTATGVTALDETTLLRVVGEERRAGRRIVLTNGCFDVLHSGHTSSLRQAKDLGDVLVVALNGDESVRRLKGPDRPINTVAERVSVIGSLTCVDHVVVFDEDTPVRLIQRLRPDVYAKGGDYVPELLDEAAAVRAYGGQVAVLDYVADRSTTGLVTRIRSGGRPGAVVA